MVLLGLDVVVLLMSVQLQLISHTPRVYPNLSPPFNCFSTVLYRWCCWGSTWWSHSCRCSCCCSPSSAALTSRCCPTCWKCTRSRWAPRDDSEPPQGVLFYTNLRPVSDMFQPSDNICHCFSVRLEACLHMHKSSFCVYYILHILELRFHRSWMQCMLKTQVPTPPQLTPPNSSCGPRVLLNCMKDIHPTFSLDNQLRQMTLVRSLHYQQAHNPSV